MSTIQEIQGLIANDDFLDIRDLLMLKINREEYQTKLSPFSFFCVKTGCEIGERKNEQIFASISTIGKDATFAVLYSTTGSQIAPHWIRTDSSALDALQLNDPVNYACYCFGLMTDNYYSKSWASRLKYQNAFTERYWALARANQITSRLSYDDLFELNSNLCYVLTFAPSTLTYIVREIGKLAYTPDALANLAANHKLIPAIKHATQTALSSLYEAESSIRRAKHDFELIPHTPGMMARGPSQIRHQSRARRKIKAEEINFMLTGLQNITIIGHTEKAKEALRLEALLDDFASIDLDAMSDFDDDDDDEVIIRKIPRSIITHQSVVSNAYIPPSNSILNRLRNKRVTSIPSIEQKSELKSEITKPIATTLDRFRRR